MAPELLFDAGLWLEPAQPLSNSGLAMSVAENKNLSMLLPLCIIVWWGAYGVGLCAAMRKTT